MVPFLSAGIRGVAKRDALSLPNWDWFFRLSCSNPACKPPNPQARQNADPVLLHVL